MTPPVVLTIAGSDSSGGAGVQADLSVLRGIGVYGACAITAITVQDTKAVKAVYPQSAEVVLEQIEAVISDLPVSAVKTGMLASGEIIDVIRELAGAGVLPNLVVDPVMRSTSGDSLAPSSAVEMYIPLIELAEVVTPNLEEAEAITGVKITSPREALDVLGLLADLGARCVVLKGGHATWKENGGECVDLVWDGKETHRLVNPRIVTNNTHGTGCSFSAAIAGWLAKGADSLEAVKRSNAYVHEALMGAASWKLGAGHGPLDHFGDKGRRYDD